MVSQSLYIRKLGEEEEQRTTTQLIILDTAHDGVHAKRPSEFKG